MGLFALFAALLVSSFVQTAVCQVDECPDGVNRCDWLPWSQWSPCSKTCGEGTRSRSRGLCCSTNETSAECIASCNVTENFSDQESCGGVCPVGNCTYEQLNNTGIEATDYQIIYDKDGLRLNPDIHLLGNEEFCEETCREGNLQHGLFCWTYSYSVKDKCYLHFFNKPLSLVHPELQGQSPGESIYLRRCTEFAECQATSADIVFVVDSSGSIGTLNFLKIKNFLQNMVNGLDIAPTLTRVGMLLFNDKTQWEFKLGEINNKRDILETIQRMQYVKGGTMTADALQKVREEGFLSNRTGVPMIAMVVTDGLSRYPPLTRFQASLLRNVGVQIYAVGVGKDANTDEIFNMASIPEENYMYEFNSFDDLDASNISLAVNYVKCPEKLVASTPMPSTVTVDQTNCTDTIRNCDGYGRDICTDYKPWATAHCSKYCGFCVGQGPTTTAKPCVDEIPNCASYGHYSCEAKEFHDWANKNCRKFCGICTPEETSPVTTQSSTVPTTAARICKDTIPDCKGYLDSCNNDQFRPYLNARCPASCGYCQSHKTVNGTMINGVKCPDWYIPTECYMEALDPDCCPLPKCPDTAYTYTVEKLQ